MVIFNPSTAFKDAVNTAILMHSVAKYVINKHFKQNEVTCGIGIDYGRMLVTKTGVQKNGSEKNNYKSLVWLGRPANVASKLTDIANKTITTTIPQVCEGHYYQPLNKWGWYKYTYGTFIDHIEETNSRNLRHKDDYFRTFFKTFTTDTISNPAILMTKPVFDGFKAACPNDSSVKNGWWTKRDVSVSGYSGEVYGGSVHFTAFSS